jgi:hypothetical protein
MQERYRGYTLLCEHRGPIVGLFHRVHRGRDEIGGVYLPSQLERTLQLLYVMVNIVTGGVGVHPPLTRLAFFYHHDGMYARKWPLLCDVLCVLFP